MRKAGTSSGGDGRKPGRNDPPGKKDPKDIKDSGKKPSKRSESEDTPRSSSQSSSSSLTPRSYRPENYQMPGPGRVRQPEGLFAGLGDIEVQRRYLRRARGFVNMIENVSGGDQEVARRIQGARESLEQAENVIERHNQEVQQVRIAHAGAMSVFQDFVFFSIGRAIMSFLGSKRSTGVSEQIVLANMIEQYDRDEVVDYFEQILINLEGYRMIIREEGNIRLVHHNAVREYYHHVQRRGPRPSTSGSSSSGPATPRARSTRQIEEAAERRNRADPNGEIGLRFLRNLTPKIEEVTDDEGQ